MDKRMVLGIDAGGTYFKAAIVSETGEVLADSALKVQADSDKDVDSVKRAYQNVVESSFAYAKKNGIALSGICIDTPGPFDYEGGRSLMTHKFRAIYGMPIREWLYEAAGETLPVTFLHDSAAFLLGEVWHSPYASYRNIAGVMIGTGLGFAMITDGILRRLPNGNPALSVWNRPYRDGIAEDYVSRRGILATYRRLCEENNKEADASFDCKEIGMLADAGDRIARETYAFTGACLGEILSPVLSEHAIELLIVGGQIARSFPVMEEALLSNLSGCVTLKKAVMSDRIEDGHILGAAAYFFSHTGT